MKGTAPEAAGRKRGTRSRGAAWLGIRRSRPRRWTSDRSCRSTGFQVRTTSGFTDVVEIEIARGALPNILDDVMFYASPLVARVGTDVDAESVGGGTGGAAAKPGLFGVAGVGPVRDVTLRADHLRLLTGGGCLRLRWSSGAASENEGPQTLRDPQLEHDVPPCSSRFGSQSRRDPTSLP